MTKRASTTDNEWNVPEWTDASQYLVPKEDDSDLLKWRWEFLRRDREYRQDWLRIRAKDTKEELALLHDPVHAPHLSRPPIFCKEQQNDPFYFQRKYKLVKLLNPAHRSPRHLLFAPYVANAVTVRFDLDMPLRAQRKKYNGQACSLQTINNDHIILKHCLNVARRKRLLTTNPATLVPIPNANNERDRVLTAEEWQRLYEVAPPHLKPILLTAYHLGQRLGEILNLTWDRVDVHRGIITLRAVDTKTNKPRQVPMTAQVKATLTELSKVRDIAHKHVFVYQRNPLREVKTAFRTACRKAGMKTYAFTT